MKTDDGPSALADIAPVSRETGERLEAFVALVRKWQRAENLVSSKTLPAIWRRHVADCAQLVPMFADARRWLDIGSGAGFPGLVVAIMLADAPGVTVHLVESNRRKCAFLRQAIAETGAPATVHEGRAEIVLAAWRMPIDRVVARAVAPLGKLLALAAPALATGAAAFHKGREFAREVDEAAQSWSFDLVVHESRIAGGGVILDISRLARRPDLNRIIDP